MEKETLPIVIVGHVDHGKSTLIGRLLFETGSLPKDKISEIKKISKELGKDTELAYLADQLKEERERNMTIDTTQIFFKTPKRNYCIIDSPGHVELIKNMITGASLAQAAVLIVDIKEGIMEQTTRHASIIDMLGIKQLLVALNKMDLVDYQKDRFEKIKSELLNFLGSLKLKPNFIIPISSKDGMNISKNSSRIAWFKGPTLLEALDLFAAERSLIEKPLRFAVQDIYTIDGERIIAGKVLSGSVTQGQEVVVYPILRKARINAIRVFEKPLRKSCAGENIGLVLENSQSWARGEIIAEKDSPVFITDNFKAEIFWMSEEPLRVEEPITLRCSTQEVECSAEKIERRINTATLEVVEENARELKLNETGQVILKTKRPVVIEKFDFIEELGRFAIERGFNLQGAGIIK